MALLSLVRFQAEENLAQRKSINVMNGSKSTTAGGKWLFGPDWPGRRCCARTRRGTPCQKPALFDNARCQLHGGRAGAPTGSRNGNYRHGEFTKETIRKRSETVAELRRLAALARKFGVIE